MMERTCLILALSTLILWTGIVVIINSSVQSNWKYFTLQVSSSSILRNTSQLGNGFITLPQCNASSLSSAKNSTVYVNQTVPSWEHLHDHIHTNLPGGHYKPTTCVPEYRTAIIVPYRDREHQLRGFLQHIHPFLQRQRIEYKIFVVELVPDILFNRAILMNIGFVESIKSDNFSCFIFHDVDLLPEDLRHLYVCGSSPIHMSAAQSNHKYKLPYHSFFGGVGAMTRSQFERVNGFSNVYFGWGGEDDDLELRMKFIKMKYIRRSVLISRYRMMDHKHEDPSNDRSQFVKTSRQRCHKDGLNSLNYTLVRHEDRKLFTWILVSVNKTEIRAPWSHLVRKPPIRPVVKPNDATQQKNNTIDKQGDVHKV